MYRKFKLLLSVFMKMNFESINNLNHEREVIAERERGYFTLMNEKSE